MVTILRRSCICCGAIVCKTASNGNRKLQHIIGIVVTTIFLLIQVHYGSSGASSETTGPQLKSSSLKGIVS